MGLIMPLKIFEGERRKTTLYILLSAIAITVVTLVVITLNVVFGNPTNGTPS